MPQFKYDSFDEMEKHRDATYKLLKDACAEGNIHYASYLKFLKIKKEVKILDKTLLKIAKGRVLIRRKK